MIHLNLGKGFIGDDPLGKGDAVNFLTKRNIWFSGGIEKQQRAVMG